MKFMCAYDELVDIDSIVENPKNNNRHSIEQIQRLAKIIKYQGQRAPLVVSKRSGFLVKGHCRLSAMRVLGWQKVAVDFQEYENEAQEFADMTADNEIARWAEFDYFKFKEDWDEIKYNLEFENFDIEFFGLEKILKQDHDETFLESDFLDDSEDDLTDGVKKRIPIEFDINEYEEALKEINYWRKQNFDVGKFLIAELKKKRK